VRDLQTQIERRDKVNAQLEDEIAKGKEKLERMLKAVEELQASDSEHQLVARRAEREVREEREKCLRLERELESWKGRSWLGGGMRDNKSSALVALSEMGDDDRDGGRRGSKRHSVNFL
jgi:myosin protein heavy chain